MQKNHYIPEFYLKGWTNDQGLLCEYSRPYEKVVPKRKTPSATGYEYDLYTVEGLPLEAAQWLEDNFLLVTDGLANQALQLFLKGQLNDVQGELKSAWSRFIISLWNRTPEKIAWLRAESKKHSASLDLKLTEVFDRLYGPESDILYADYREGPGRHADGLTLIRLMQTLMDLENVGQHLNNMRWSILTAHSVPEPFLTSDRPVIKEIGLADPSAYVIVPLSPTKIFVAVNQETTLEYVRSFGRRPLVAKVNSVIARQATKYVYGPDDTMLSFVERRLNRDPEARRLADTLRT